MNNHKKKYFKKNILGQHFLHNINVIKKIIFFIKPQINDCLIEVGSGLGALTYPISKHVKNIHAIEIDKNIVNKMKKNKLFNNKIIIYNEDVMKFNFLNLAKKKKIRLYGNLPYNISTQLIFYLLNFSDYIQDMHFMFQKEVAERLISKPNNRKYGRLTVISQYYYIIKKILEVNSKCFTPIPQVDSVVLKMVPYKNKYSNKFNIDVLKNILKIAFSKKRKIIKNSLNTLFSYKILKKLSIYHLRPENVSLKQYCKLAQIYTEYSKNRD